LENLLQKTTLVVIFTDFVADYAVMFILSSIAVRISAEKKPKYMPKRIAIIEDDHSIALMYELKLSRSGFEVKIAPDGKEGLALAGSFFPDLILLDLMMPELRGDEMLEKLRQTDWGAKMRVIVLTNLSKDEAPHGLRLLNVDRYIVKAHHTPAQVVEVVRDVLREKAPAHGQPSP
jgi:DNA-binding response OmpR family regulator